MPILRDQAWTAGIMVATTGVLLRKPLSNATGNAMRAWAERTERGERSRWLTIRSTPPEWWMPAATTNMATTVISPLLLKPARA